MGLATGNESDAGSNQQEVQLACSFMKDVHDWTDEAIKKEMFYSKLETVKITIIVPFIFSIGLLGNCAFLLLLARVKAMRTLTNFFLANLAAADIMVLFVKVGYLVGSYQKSIIVWSEPFYSNWGCALHELLCFTSYCASILLINFISFDRYFAICHPVKYRFMKNKKNASLFMLFFVWTTSLVLAVLAVMCLSILSYNCIIWPSGEQYKNFPEFGQYCGLFHPGFKHVFNTILAVPFILALCTNSFLYIKIVKKLKQPLGEKGGSSQHQKIKQRITWMLMANAIVYFCCLTPTQYLIISASKLDHASADWARYIHTAYIFIMVNSAVNPIIYGVASPSYRRGFLKAFGLAKNQVEPGDEPETEETKSTVTTVTK